MQITRTKINWVNPDAESNFKAAVAVTFNHEFEIHPTVVEFKGRLHVAMPNRKSLNGTYHDTAHPINSETRKYIEDAVLSAYQNATDTSLSADECASLKITSTRITWVNPDTESNFKAAVAVTFDDTFTIHPTVVEFKGELRVVMPNRKSKDGTYHDTAHPINAKTRKYIEDAVFPAYHDKINGCVA